MAKTLSCYLVTVDEKHFNVLSINENLLRERMEQFFGRIKSVKPIKFKYDFDKHATTVFFAKKIRP